MVDMGRQAEGDGRRTGDTAAGKRQDEAAVATKIRLPVRTLVEFLFRSGSIDSRFTGGAAADRGVLGTRLHRMLQRRGGAGYTAEVTLSIEETLEEFTYHLSGRADGVIDTGAGLVVDEIKTTARPLESLAEDDTPAHWAQGCCYAHILCRQRGLAGAAVQLRYCHIETAEVRSFERQYTARELADFFAGVLQAYQRWARLAARHRRRRDDSLRALAFPFEQYRGGQREMAIACYNTFKGGGRLMCCAPTGIGKTVSALFPAMKALGEGYGERIFYLTAKTITRKAAEDAIDRLGRAAPLSFRSLTLTAKDKACPLEQRACFPEACPYADGYYDRVNDAVYAILEAAAPLTRDGLAALAEHYRLCPYELSLDLALWCDCIIGDYNYLFDPTVHLQRFFEQGGEYLFLVDEAHNLVERSREMYSARLRKGDFSALKRRLPKHHTRLHRALAAVNTAFVALRRRCEDEQAQVLRREEMPEELERPLERFAEAAAAFLEDHRGGAEEDALLELYFGVLFYQQMAEGYDRHYCTLIYRQGAEVTAKLFCMDPAHFLDKSLALGRAAVLFSATLQPLPYYRQTLGCASASAGAKLLDLPSPFAQQHLGLFVAAGVSTKYAARPASIAPVAGMLHTLVSARGGNYIAYFPSYSYMRQVYEAFAFEYPGVATVLQQAGMDEDAREAYLARFEAGGRLLGFCVMGGVFAEGVDLPGERLSGVAVVGVGLPQMGPEPDALRDYYDEANGCGFEYAYQFPGMNKVLQAAGRVIRTESDRGVVLLVDDRFPSGRYQALFPQHWNHWQRVGTGDLADALAAFWRGVENQDNYTTL